MISSLGLRPRDRWLNFLICTPLAKQHCSLPFSIWSAKFFKTVSKLMEKKKVGGRKADIQEEEGEGGFNQNIF